MNRNKLLILLTTLLVLAISACNSSNNNNGGGGGGGDLATGGFTKTVQVGPGTQQIAFFGMNSFFHMQWLYRSMDMKGAGNITHIRFQYELNLVTAVSCPNTTIKLGHTDVTDLVADMTTAYDNGQGALVTVVDDATIDIPAGLAGDIIEIVLETPFAYNGRDNLVLDFTKTTACTGNVEMRSYGTTGYSSGVYSNSVGTPNTASGLLAWLAYAEFVFAGGENEQNMDGAVANVTPLGFSTPRIQNLYLASEIDGSGPITGLALQMDSTSVAGTYTYNLKIGHSTLSTLGTTYDNNYSDTPVTVANAVTVNIPAGVPAGGWVWEPLPDGVFDYNGTDNLIVEFDRALAGTASNSVRTTSIAGRRAEGQSGNATADAVDDVYYHAKFRFHGAKLEMITPGATGSAGEFIPYFTDDGVGQYLYLAAELGTSGQITQIGCRKTLSSAAAQTGLNYTITLSHTTASTLGTDRATNLPTPSVVLNGSFDQPVVAGGDWFDVPLSTPFTYNGVDNLVVEFSGTGGTNNSGVTCRTDNFTPSLFGSRQARDATSSATTLTLDNRLIDIRFSISK